MVIFDPWFCASAVYFLLLLRCEILRIFENLSFDPCSQVVVL